ncbi:MAG: hypothetical protein IMY76_05340 [Chloroflexi bacterium]|nr:hypothetical protein [Chloroflexota bacterium]
MAVLPLEERVTSWSRQHWIVILSVGIGLWMLYTMIAPGDDYIRCYTWMVENPEKLPEVADYPWTLNPTWLAPFMAPFVSLPGQSGYSIFMLATIAVTIYATKIFGGKPILTLLSAHMFWILWWGQIEGWAILGLVLAWFAYRKKSWPLMFLALSMASFKPQVGLVPVVALWWWSGKDRWKSMVALMGLFIASLFIWGPWPVWYLEGIIKFISDGHSSVSNASVGLFALPLFIPALLLPMDKEKRLIALTATTYLVSPYMPYYSTILLFIFALPGWAYLFGLLGYFPKIFGTTIAWNGVVFLPLTILVWLYLPIVKQFVSRKQKLNVT